MKKLDVIIILIALLLTYCTDNKSSKTAVFSPDKSNSIEFILDKNGVANYIVKHKGKTVVDTSSLGFDFKNLKSLSDSLRVIDTKFKTIDETWEMPWGEQRMVKNNCNEMCINLKETTAPNRKLRLYFRAYNDGIAFRYELLPQQGVDTVIIMDENTEFQLTGDHKVWWTPGDWDIYEHIYNTSKLSEIDAVPISKTVNLAQTYIPQNAVNTPVTMRTKDGLHISFHEAALTNYSGMTLKMCDKKYLMKSELVGSDRLGYKAKCALPFKTPWRTIQIAEKAGELIESKLIVNLNEANKLGDVSWFKPMKYVGIWWEMHIGKSFWDLKSKKHGANTQNAKRYIDFASENGIKGVLIEGWNTGWEKWVGFEDREGVFDFVTPYSDYNFAEVVQYAKDKGVDIIMHHETSAAPRTYEKQLDTAYRLMQNYGIHSVKTGYVGKIIPKGEYHHGQWMVNHYRKVLETAAKHKVAVDAHEPIKATGIRRTYPNAIAREGLRGQEFNAWSIDGGNPPEHISIVAFTRMLAGPIDFTPGVFDISLPSKPKNQVNTTLAHQLALYVVIYSPIQMACDLPENYKGNPAFQFIKDVGVDWEQTKVLNGEIGDFVTIARQEKNTGNWFVGAVSDENEREITINFDFLPQNGKYKATVYKDGKDADYKNNPLGIDIEQIEVNSQSKKIYKLAKGGGLAISIIKVKE